MKTKRAGLLNKATQGDNKKAQKTKLALVADASELQDDAQNDHSECERGACAIAWKPPTVSVRR